jgi:hypothetical protein
VTYYSICISSRVPTVPSVTYTLFSNGVQLVRQLIPCLSHPCFSELSSSSYTATLASSSMEHRHLLVHDLGSNRLPKSIHKLYHLARQCNRLGSHMVRYMYAFVYWALCFFAEHIPATRIIVGVAVALPAASLCINRRLYKIAVCQTANVSAAHVS